MKRHDPTVFEHLTDGRSSMNSGPIQDMHAGVRQHDTELTGHLMKITSAIDKKHGARQGDAMRGPIRGYTGEWSERINKQLAGIRSPDTSITLLHNGLKSYFDLSNAHAGVGHDMHVYSGMSRARVPKAAVGEEVNMPSYTSTSINVEKAHDWAEDDAGGDRHIAHFHIPAGQRDWMYLEPHSSNRGEHEVLLNAGSNATYTGTQKFSGHRGTVHVHSFVMHDHKTNKAPEHLLGDIKKQGSLF